MRSHPCHFYERPESKAVIAPKLCLSILLIKKGGNLSSRINLMAIGFQSKESDVLLDSQHSFVQKSTLPDSPLGFHQNPLIFQYT